jgi:hypothetical protein
MLLMRGEALDEPNRFWGTSIEVRMEQPVQEVLDRVVSSGFEHHYALVWQDVTGELSDLCGILDIPVVAV